MDNHFDDFSRAITAALDAGMLEDAEFLIETETKIIFGDDEEIIELSLDDVELL